MIFQDHKTRIRWNWICRSSDSRVHALTHCVCCFLSKPSCNFNVGSWHRFIAWLVIIFCNSVFSILEVNFCCKLVFFFLIVMIIRLFLTAKWKKNVEMSIMAYRWDLARLHICSLKKSALGSINTILLQDNNQPGKEIQVLFCFVFSVSLYHISGLPHPLFKNMCVSACTHTWTHMYLVYMVLNLSVKSYKSKYIYIHIYSPWSPCRISSVGY